MKYLMGLALPALLLAGMVSHLAGQTGYVEEQEIDQPRFDFDFAAFRSDGSPDVVRVEIYYKIFNDGLQYFKQDDKFVASYEISVVVLDGDDNQVTGFSRERKYTVDDYKQTRNSADYLINQFDMDIPEGEFKIVCRLTDKLSGKVASIERDLSVENLFRNEIDMSDIEFVRAVRDIEGSKSAFDKGEKRVIPIVTRRLSGEREKAAFYVEIYNTGTKAREVVIKYRVKGRRSKPVYKDEFSVTLDKSLTRLIKEIPTDNLVPDEYEISFELKEKAPRKKKWAERKAVFEVAWSLRALVKNDFKTAVEQLKYIASRDELEKLKDLEDAELQEREMAFEEFWKAHDKYPETPENETRALYYGRIRHADRNFSVVNQPGWRTDRGRIYVIFGEPDNVERYPFELDNVPYQVWHYYRLSRTFVFEDTHHTGDYHLTYPYDGRRGGLHEGFEDFN
jgi:GWxTD domain-containing protein